MSFDKPPNMLSKIFLIPLFLCIMSSGLLGAAIIPCTSDSDCPINHYCYTKTHICAECVSNFCSRIHRKDSSWKKCHTEPSDCGPCLPGYEEEYFSDGNKRAACILSISPTPSQYSGYVNNTEGFSPFYFSGFLGCFIFSILGFLMYRKARSGTVRIIHSEDYELRPMNNPEMNDGINENINNAHVYEPSAPILPHYSSKDPFPSCGNDLCENVENAEDYYESKVKASEPVDCHENHFRVKKPKSKTKLCETLHLVKSAVFKKPNYEEESVDNAASVLDDEEDPESQEEEDDNTTNFSVSPVLDHDESTIPSTWTPEPSQPVLENTTLSNNPETTKRPSTEMGSSESEDEQNPKRACNNGSEEEDTSSSLPIRNFRLAFTRPNQNTNTNNTQSKNSEGPTKDK